VARPSAQLGTAISQLAKVVPRVEMGGIVPKFVPLKTLIVRWLMRRMIENAPLTEQLATMVFVQPKPGIKVVGRMQSVPLTRNTTIVQQQQMAGMAHFIAASNPSNGQTTKAENALQISVSRVR
jgi:hypothetical protein